MNKAAITGIEGYVPDHILSNTDLEKMVDTTNDWIISRTGIKERRILKDSKNVSIIESNNFKRFSTKDFSLFNSKYFYNFSPILLLKMTNDIYESELDELPFLETKKTVVPEWRSTIGFKYNNTETSYQGEINPFPSKASLLTWAY